MQQHGVTNLVVLDREQRVRGYLTQEDAQRHANQVVEDIMNPLEVYTQTRATLRDAFSEMLTNTIRQLPVVDDDDRYLGVITLDMAQQTIAKNGGQKGA
jgi:CBS domain-containing protein